MKLIAGGRYTVPLVEPTLHNKDAEQVRLFQRYTRAVLEHQDLDVLAMDLGIDVFRDGSSLLTQSVPVLCPVPHLQNRQSGEPVLLRRSVYDGLETEVLRLSGYVKGQKPYLLPLLVDLIEQAPQVVQGTVDETVQNVLVNIAGRWTVKEEVRGCPRVSAGQVVLAEFQGGQLRLAHSGSSTSLGDAVVPIPIGRDPPLLEPSHDCWVMRLIRVHHRTTSRYCATRGGCRDTGTQR